MTRSLTSFSRYACLLLLLAPAITNADDTAGKLKLLEKFRAKALKAETQQGINIDYSQAQKVCEDPEATITSCRRSIRTSNQELDQKIKNPGITSKTPVTTHIVGKTYGDQKFKIPKKLVEQSR